MNCKFRLIRNAKKIYAECFNAADSNLVLDGIFCNYYTAEPISDPEQNTSLLLDSLCKGYVFQALIYRHQLHQLESHMAVISF